MLCRSISATAVSGQDQVVPVTAGREPDSQSTQLPAGLLPARRRHAGQGEVTLRPHDALRRAVGKIKLPRTFG